MHQPQCCSFIVVLLLCPVSPLGFSFPGEAYITHPIDRICLPVQFSQHRGGVQQDHWGRPVGVERKRVMWEGAEKQGECERRTVWAPRVTAQSGAAEMGTRKVWGGSRPANAERKRNGDEKIGREQTIVIKLSMRSRRSCKALIWFNHHEIRALRRSTRQRQHRCRHALCLSAGSRKHWSFPFLEVRTL